VAEANPELQSIKQRFGIIGNSPGINYALEVALRVSPTNLTVLITGESGAGKEIFSHIIHQNSTRKHSPFIAVNCGAIPEGTIDSELFGHEKGAFTGASEQRKGYFEAVNGGTIFLDEIGEMPLQTQARLLRILETGEFIKVGSSKVQKTDVRVVAATNVELPKVIAQGKFREDLYYRLNTVPIEVPPLRERKEDIALLFRKFAVDFGERYSMPSVMLDNDAKRLLENQPWSGNIRELKNVAEQVSVLAREKVIDAETLKRFLPNQSERHLPIPLSDLKDEKQNYSERELLYKILFDMRQDIQELKHFVLQLAGGRDVSGFNSGLGVNPSSTSTEYVEAAKLLSPESPDMMEPVLGSGIHSDNASDRPIVIHHDTVDEEAIEESLSIADKEKELIQKALEKHKGKRKDAALDLGISERTLYRKIKEYAIHE
jgi:transcriptional regulator with PAS, ATPase and Fis domain